MRQSGRPLSPESRGWLAVAVLFAAGVAWRDSEVLQFFDVLAMLTALVLLAMSLAAIPVAGLAFARAIERRPQLNLYVADKRHPSVAGTYLAAATTFGALFRRPPNGLKYTAGLDQETAGFLQATAWETLLDFYPQLGTTARN